MAGALDTTGSRSDMIMIVNLNGVKNMVAAVRDGTTDEWLAAHPQPDVASF